MKKNFLVTAKAFALAMACTMVMGCANNTNNTANNAPAAPSSDIAYVNMDSLIDKYDLYNDLSTQLMAKHNWNKSCKPSKNRSNARRWTLKTNTRKTSSPPLVLRKFNKIFK